MGRQAVRGDPAREHPAGRVWTNARGPRSNPGPALLGRMNKLLRLSDRQVGVLFMLPFIVDGARLHGLSDRGSRAAVVLRLQPAAARRSSASSGCGISSLFFDDPLFWDSFHQATIWTSAVDRLPDRARRRPGDAAAPDRCAGISIFRGLLLFPYIVPTVVIALNWRWIFNPEIGIVNHALKSAGLISENIYWLSTPDMAMASTIMLNVWKYTPFVIICVLARLQTDPARALRRRQGRRRRDCGAASSTSPCRS